MFNPTHVLISRTRQVPVQLISTKEGMLLLTEPEWQQQAEPAFMMHPKRGFFCKGIQIVGYSLQPLSSEFAPTAGEPTQAVQGNAAQAQSPQTQSPQAQSPQAQSAQAQSPQTLERQSVEVLASTNPQGQASGKSSDAIASGNPSSGNPSLSNPSSASSSPTPSPTPTSAASRTATSRAKATKGAATKASVDTSLRV